MLVLGIDPGTAICGYGFVELMGSRLCPHAYGAITTPSKMEVEKRLLKIHTELTLLIEKYSPDAMGVEQLFFNRNVTTAIPVGQARGIALLAAAQNNIPIVERTPLQVKYMVTKLLNLPAPPHPDDTADALAVAISAAHCVDSIAWRNRI